MCFSSVCPHQKQPSDLKFRTSSTRLYRTSNWLWQDRMVVSWSHITNVTGDPLPVHHPNAILEPRSDAPGGQRKQRDNPLNKGQVMNKKPMLPFFHVNQPSQGRDLPRSRARLTTRQLDKWSGGGVSWLEGIVMVSCNARNNSRVENAFLCIA